jgi:hypothetical protein
MKKVYICAPLAGDVPANLERAKEYAKYALKCGTAPVVPHFYSLILDDDDPEQRSLGMKAGQAFGNYEWRVLEVSGDKALLITEDIIKQGQQYQDALKISAKDETTHYLWAYSLVRAYCNGEFLNTFSAEEQALIIHTALVMEPNPASGQESGPSTTDQIWCLSVSEAQTYFTYETAYARNHTNNKTELWWLRTTGSSFMTACVAPHVLSTASEVGKYVGTNSIDGYGVRPALWVRLT